MLKRIPAGALALVLLLTIDPGLPLAGRRPVDPAGAAEMPDFGNSVVQVRVTSQARSLTQPWAVKGVESSSGSGILIEPGRILTNAHVVENATFIQVDLLGVDDPVEAAVEAINHQVDLALLAIAMPPGFTLSATRFGDLPKVRDRVVIGGYPIGGSEISYTTGVVSRIDVDWYSHSGIKNLMVQTDAAINPGNSGGPVYLAETGALVGLATQINTEGENLGYLIPTPVINQFLEDYRDDGAIQGIPSLGVQVQFLENPTLREYLKMGEASGVRVTGVARGGTADGWLREGDVLLEMDGIKILNLGDIRLANGEKIDHVAHVSTRKVGDTLALKILRDGERLDLKLPLKAYVFSAIPPCPMAGTAETYLTHAGLVFVEVDGNYLTLWDKDTPGIFDYYFGRPRGTDGFDGFVVISSVNTGSVNKGYEDCIDLPVVEINGRRISRLADVKAAFAGAAENDVIKLHDNTLLVLSRRKAAAEEGSLRQKYGLPGE